MPADPPTSNGNNPRHQQLSLGASLLAAGFSITALIFSLGVNYQKMLGIEAEVAALQSRESNYVRKDVSIEQYQRLTERLNGVSQQVDEIRLLMIQRQSQAAPGGVPSTSPRFAR